MTDTNPTVETPAARTAREIANSTVWIHQISKTNIAEIDVA